MGSLLFELLLGPTFDFVLLMMALVDLKALDSTQDFVLQMLARVDFVGLYLAPVLPEDLALAVI